MSNSSGGGNDQSRDGTKNGRESEGGDNREEDNPEGEGQKRRGHVVVGEVDNPGGHCADAHKEGEDVEKADGGDGDDRRFTRRSLTRDRIVTNEDVGQRSSTTEKSEHE